MCYEYICRHRKFGFPKNPQNGWFLTLWTDDNVEKGLFDFRWLGKDLFFSWKKLFAKSYEVFISRNFSFDFKNPIKCWFLGGFLCSGYIYWCIYYYHYWFKIIKIWNRLDINILSTFYFWDQHFINILSTFYFLGF